jgi:signal transduction histidine kinase
MSIETIDSSVDGPYSTSRVRGGSRSARLDDEFERKVCAPLGTIAMTSALLRHEVRGDNTDPIDSIAAAAQRIEGMTHDLLNFVRWTVEGVRLTCRRVDLKVLCERVVDALRESHSDRAIVLTAKESVEGTFDPDAVAAMLSNLILNALHHGRRRPAVRVALLARPDTVQLEVWNAGPSIKRRLRADLFQPFVRGEASSSRTTAGLGLGLYFAREIVHAHNGSIDVQSFDGGGTTFRVRFPRV